MYAPISKGDSTARVPRQQHYYGLNHLHYLTASTYRRARIFDSRVAHTLSSMYAPISKGD